MKRRHFLRSALKASTLLGGVGLLAACTPTEVRRSVSAGRSLYRGNVPSAVMSQLPATGLPEVDRLLRRQVSLLVKRLAKQWGDKKVASPKEYVKYLDQYQTRAIINFETGKIRVETLEKSNPKQALQKAIITTLLTPEDPQKVDLLSDKAVALKGQPFLYPLVKDQYHKPIRTQWRANQYAKYLLKKAYHHDIYHGKRRYFVTFAMEKHYQDDQAHRYAGTVKYNAKRFKLDQALIFAIIKTESSFNPYAMSPIPAFGLMQIVPRSAGRDAHRFLFKKDGIPSKNYLFQAHKNIEMGSAYLYLLHYRYLVKIKHPKSREYCAIAAYNTGTGNVFKAFASSRSSAIARINRMSPSQVYTHLTHHLKYAEARRYVQKVTRNKRAFQT